MTPFLISIIKNASFIYRAFLMETYYPFSTSEADYIFFRAKAGRCLFAFWLFFVRPYCPYSDSIIPATKYLSG